MTAVGVLFILIGVFAAVACAWLARSAVCVALYVCHVGAALFYWQYTLVYSGDATAYYEYVNYGAPIGPGTSFIRWLTASVRDLFGATYLDMYMIYHLAGYVGLVIFFLMCRRLTTGSEGTQGRALASLAYILPFLPSLHVWTSAIGKDGLMFMGILLFLGGAANPRSGLVTMAVGLLVAALVRPHMATMLAVAAVLAAAMSRDLPLLWRLGLGAPLCVALVAAMPQLQQFLALDTFDAESVAEYVQRRQEYNLGGGSSLDLSEYPFPIQFFTYMYRPLFFDANGILGLIVSIENLIYLIATLICIPRLVRLLSGTENAFFWRLNFFFWTLSTAVLATTTANLGIAMRQKTMVLPSLLVLVVGALLQRHPEERTSTDEQLTPA